MQNERKYIIDNIFLNSIQKSTLKINFKLNTPFLSHFGLNIRHSSVIVSRMGDVPDNNMKPVYVIHICFRGSSLGQRNYTKRHFLKYFHFVRHRAYFLGFCSCFAPEFKAFHLTFQGFCTPKMYLLYFDLVKNVQRVDFVLRRFQPSEINK